MFCQRCGTEVPNDAGRCTSCGFDIGATTPMRAIATGESQAPRKASDDLERIREALADEYQDFSLLGRGGMAVVYQAKENVLQREVAIKVLPFQYAHDDDFVERFLREARTAASLEHPNIIPIYRVGKRHDVLFIVMKYLAGKSLAAVLAQRGPLPPRDIARILMQSAEGLGHAHKHGVVHRDVKPDNIIFRTAATTSPVVVCDFGIAKASSATRLTGTGMVIGTPFYMSPEQVRTRELDGRSDIYSLGVVAYQCLTGRVPFQGEDSFAIGYQHVTEPLPVPNLKTPEERRLFNVINRMMAKEPNDRFQNTQALVDALQDNTPTRDALPPVVAAPEQPVAQGPAPETIASVASSPGIGRSTVETPTTPMPRSSVGQMTSVRRARRKSRAGAWVGATAVLLLGGLGGGGYYYVEFMGGTLPFGLGRTQPNSGMVADSTTLAANTPALSVPTATGDSTAPVQQDDPADSRVTNAGEPLSADSVHREEAVGVTDSTPQPPATPSNGLVVVSGLGPNARLLVNGQSVRGVRHALAPGRYAITAQRDGFLDFRDSVTVEANNTTQLTVRWRAIQVEPEREAPALMTSQCEVFNPSYNGNGSCFDVQPRLQDAPLVPLDGTVPRAPTRPALLAIEVLVDGTAGRVLILNPSDVPEFAALAVDFANRLRFDPAQKDGRAVKGWLQQPFHAEVR